VPASARRAALATVVPLTGLLVGCGVHPTVSAEHPTTTTTTRPATTTTSATPTVPPLPGGGNEWFPGHRVVAYYGTPGTASLGVLGAYAPEEDAQRLARAAAAFQTPDRVVVPAFELIATVADRSPGPDGSYSHPIDPGSVERYLQVARAHGMELILDIQPGRADFLPEVQRWSGLLAQPDVGLALDAEWHLGPGQVPGESIGSVDAAGVNAVSDWLAGLVRSNHLPQKLFVLHQFTGSMITDPDAITPHPELAAVQHLDGFGTRAEKLAKYTALRRPDLFHLGFKLFYTQDVAMMSPADVLALSPPPDFVSYQ
jgi:hypothetical protein